MRKVRSSDTGRVVHVIVLFRSGTNLQSSVPSSIPDHSQYENDNYWQGIDWHPMSFNMLFCKRFYSRNFILGKLPSIPFFLKECYSWDSMIFQYLRVKASRVKYSLVCFSPRNYNASKGYLGSHTTFTITTLW